MTGGALPYIGLGTRRQLSWLPRGFAFAFMALTLGGCAGLGMPFGGVDRQHTASITRASDIKPVLAKAVVTEQVHTADWETVRRTAEGAPKTAAKLDWINPETGSTGTLSIAVAGAGCRAFATTVNDVRGIRRYRGEACLREDGRTQLHGLTADDATLL